MEPCGFRPNHGLFYVYDVQIFWGDGILRAERALESRKQAEDG